ncbi:hypothetical protein AI2839V1_2883 [Enterobacter cloacae]|uniref:Lipoprotein n=2 Tax=Enterobacter sichuanensis TaxID=2071710 RepID=A0AAE4DW58_9ENTR|nr:MULTISPECIES: hypothetical protein [Enterobacter]MCI8906259.1 hypothetical protein [Enterobacter sp.]MDR9946107.1 hypothetical protein [Enterobacter sichuanensis]CAF2461467.1 hypothetical protein AI2839V1_2883 [Enterobacter cloacae]CAH5340752.1 hypothetical protein AI2839V1_2883 [Enterobacter cloacae]
MKYGALLLAVSTLAACQSSPTSKAPERVTLTRCDNYEISILPATTAERQTRIWVNENEFISDGKREITRNEYMPFHTYLYGRTTPVADPQLWNIAALTAAPEGVTLLRYHDSTEVGKAKCAISEAALKTMLHDSALPY